MATTLYARESTTNGIGTFRDLLDTRGALSTTGVVATAAGTQTIQWTKTSGGAVLEWISRPLAGGFTLSGNVSINLRALESATAANAGGHCKIYKRTAAGVETEIGAASDGVEFATSDQVRTWTITPTSTAFAQNDRLIVRFYIQNVGSMGSGRTCTMSYDGPTGGAAGDTFITLTETVTFKPEPQSATVGLVQGTETVQAVQKRTTAYAGDGKLKTKIGSFSSPTSTGQQTVTVGFRPKCVIIDGNEQQGSNAGDAITMRGVVTNDNQQIQQWVCVVHDNNGAAAAQTVCGRDDDACVMIPQDNSTTNEVRGRVVDITDTGFVVDWTHVAASARPFHYVALGGDALMEASAGTFLSRSGAGSVYITGLGYTPNFVMLVTSKTTDGSGLSVEDARINIGMAAADGQICSSWLSETGADPSDTWTYFDSGSRLVKHMTTDGLSFLELNLGEFNTDGARFWQFTTEADRVINYLCIKLDGNVSVFHDQWRTTTGTKSKTGMTFKPSLLLTVGNVRVALDLAVSQPARIGRGAGNATDQYTLSEGANDNVATMQSWSMADSAKILLSINGTGGTVMATALQSLNSDGYTFNYTTVDGFGRYFGVAAFKGTNDGAPTNVNAGLVTSAGSIFAVTYQKQKTVGLITSVDSVFSVGENKSKQIGLVTGASTLFALDWSKVKSIGLVSEVGQVNAIIANKTSQIGLVSGASQEFPLTFFKQKQIGLITRTDTTFSLTPGRSITVGLSQVVGSPFGITGLKNKSVGLVTGVGQVQVVDHTRSMQIGLVTGAGTVNDLFAQKNRTVGLITGVGTTFPVEARVAAELGFATTVGSVFAITGQKQKTIEQVVDSGIVLPTTINRAVAVGGVTGTGSVFSVSGQKSTTVQPVESVGSTMPVQGTKQQAIGQVERTGVVQPLTSQKVKSIGMPTSGGIVLPVGVLRAKAVGLVQQVGSVLPLGGLKNKSTDIVIGAGTVFPVEGRVATDVGLVTGVGSVFALQSIKRRQIDNVTGIGTVFGASVRIGPDLPFLEDVRIQVVWPQERIETYWPSPSTDGEWE